MATHVTLTDEEGIALRRSERHCRDLVDAASDALVVCDDGGRILAVNQSACDLFGYTREEALAMSIDALSSHEPPYTPAHARAHVVHARERGSHTFDWRSRKKNGDVFWSEVVLRATDGDGERRTIASVRDITERRRHEATLHDSEELFHRIFNSSSNSIALTEPLHGRILDVNDTWVRESGLRREDVIGRTARDLGLWANVEARAEVMSLLERHGRVREFETALRMRSVRDYVINAEFVELRDGAGILWEFRDVTDKKRVDQEQALLRAQLQQAQRMESVGRLAGGVAHDFNNLLTVILSLARLMAEAPRSRADAEDLAQIGAAAERAADLTSQLLAFARRQIVEPRLLDLNDLVRNVDKMLRRIIGENIDLATFCEEGLGTIRADNGQLEQVLMNLAVNARDAMTAGGHLTIETGNVTLDEDYATAHSEVAPGDYVMLCVSDTGTGIDPDVLDHIFEPFFTTKPKDKGTGLGLSTCYGIVRQHGGSIWAYSEPGKGTAFKVYFPRVWSDAETRAVPVPEPPALGHERILVVEDDDMLRRIAVRVLTSNGYLVEESPNGASALTRFDELSGRVDLLLTDVVMPGMSGKDLGTELLRRRPDLKVLYTSGYTENTIMHHGVVDASVNFLAKPYVPAELLRRVREVLDRAQRPGNSGDFSQ